MELRISSKKGEAMKNFSGNILIGRPATPEDIVPTALFLASSDSDYVTGQIMAIDGGQILVWGASAEGDKPFQREIFLSPARKSREPAAGFSVRDLIVRLQLLVVRIILRETSLNLKNDLTNNPINWLACINRYRSTRSFQNLKLSCPKTRGKKMVLTTRESRDGSFGSIFR